MEKEPNIRNDTYRRGVIREEKMKGDDKLHTLI